MDAKKSKTTKSTMTKVHDISTAQANVDSEKEGPDAKSHCLTFVNEVSILGVKYVTNQNLALLRRIIWLCFVLAGFGFLIYHLHNRISYFYRYPSSVNIELNYPDSIPFPSVTICNNNRFRKSSLNASGELDVGYLYTTPNTQTTRNLTGYNWTEFYRTHGHQAEQMLGAPGACRWNGRYCSPSQFTEVITDLGLCFTFNHGDTGLQTKIIGSTFGLTLILNTEQYDYLDTTFNAGFTILPHHPDNTPYVDNLGFQIAPGEFVSVGLSQTKIQNLPPPYGKCTDKHLAYYSPYTTTHCLTECRLNFTIRRCGCRETHMVPVDDVPECSPLQYWGCIVGAISELADEYINCACSVPCLSYDYGYTISHSKMSNAFSQVLSATYPTYTKEYFLENYLMLSLYYTELNYQLIEQQVGYEGLALFADIGGALGLVLGSTLMTGAEIMDFVIAMGMDILYQK
ncbi:acid-sensing ion channel 1-like [Lingula anatina]|uniref:Acid-sensing ion channel 1-like n=1 Tax=Lingula anatina TaxID=7574 RepID=A0A1S3HHB3_LINAN|nr:acid-sensing ion channel 1-like [Lingula anatina]|eukprot:XP_013384881.1 acid-sensing ion channel 1-like [Lingula anatina]